mgnify:CR=1 FL=1
MTQPPGDVPFDRVGGLLQSNEPHYSVRYEAGTKQWFILDLWSDELQNLGPDSDVTQVEYPALIKLSEMQFDVLMQEANRLGVMRRYSGAPASPEGPGDRPPPDGPFEPPRSSDGEIRNGRQHTLKLRALDIIEKVVLVSDLSEFAEREGEPWTGGI